MKNDVNHGHAASDFWPRQEAHLVSSLQDLFKDQEKRIATVIAAWHTCSEVSAVCGGFG